MLDTLWEERVQEFRVLKKMDRHQFRFLQLILANLLDETTEFSGNRPIFKNRTRPIPPNLSDIHQICEPCRGGFVSSLVHTLPIGRGSACDLMNT
jgi:hypothetical protein